MKKNIRWAILLVAALSLAAGCTNSANTDTAKAADKGFPVSVSGKLGTATITHRPKRVVALSWTDADIALSLGVTPIAMQKIPVVAGGVEPWTKQWLKGATPTLLDTSKGDPIDKIVALKPDLILATKDYALQQSYPQLSKFAPVVSYVNGPNLDTWQDATRTIAKALGVPDRASGVISKTESQISQTKAAHPELNGKTYTFLISPNDSGIWAINTTKDVSAQFMASLGLSLTPTVTKMPTSSTPGRAFISFENLDKADADIIILTGPPGTPAKMKAIPGFRHLKAITKNAYVPLDLVPAEAIGFPSAPSLDWALKNLIPDLSQAAKR
ncbi:iron-siderophore ABC transporter substrate-binding protein [Actinoallomurus acaciae]|uniref:Iron-siderophore ABC transporter substrate-binding protein n=1 Tax=Actinoallomurus acaciae TaxID=502577 RepID=A0ABV5YLD8_9ACTN